MPIVVKGQLVSDASGTAEQMRIESTELRQLLSLPKEVVAQALRMHELQKTNVTNNSKGGEAGSTSLDEDTSSTAASKSVNMKDAGEDGAISVTTWKKAKKAHRGKCLQEIDDGHDVRITTFVNDEVFRYCKHFVDTRDEAADTEIAKFVKEKFWENHFVDNGLFPEWWQLNRKVIKDKIRTKRVNQTGLIRRVFKGK